MTGLRRGRIRLLGAALSLFVPVLVLALPQSSASADTMTWSNSSGITMPTSGIANPFPSAIQVDQPGVITGITVSINSFQDDYPTDIDLVLQAPNGDALLLMAGVSNATVSQFTNITFDDAGAAPIPEMEEWDSGVYQPTAYSTPTLPSGDDPTYGPGPGGIYSVPGPIEGGSATLSSTFGGDPASGAWKLWAADSDDEVSSLGGQISEGWSLSITTAASYTLTVVPGGSGSGTIYGPGIHCPGDCTQSFPVGTKVTLVPLPESGSHFTGWSGACSGTTPCSLTIAGNTSVTAALDRDPDTGNPQTTILTRPDKRTQLHHAGFTFTADEPNVTYQCALDGSGFHRCLSGVKFHKLAAGRHHFRVRAVNEFGNSDARPATYVWKVVQG